MNKPLIDQAVDRFLGWKLPADFAPDAGISFTREANPKSPPELRFNHEPIGTNLLTADQAKAMLTHVAEPLLGRIAELERDAALLDFLESQQDISYQDHHGHWMGIDGGNIRYFLEAHKAKYDAAMSKETAK